MNEEVLRVGFGIDFAVVECSKQQLLMADAVNMLLISKSAHEAKSVYVIIQFALHSIGIESTIEAAPCIELQNIIISQNQGAVYCNAVLACVGGVLATLAIAEQQLVTTVAGYSRKEITEERRQQLIDRVKRRSHGRH